MQENSCRHKISPSSMPYSANLRNSSTRTKTATQTIQNLPQLNHPRHLTWSRLRFGRLMREERQPPNVRVSSWLADLRIMSSISVWLKHSILTKSKCESRLITNSVKHKQINLAQQYPPQTKVSVYTRMHVGLALGDTVLRCAVLRMCNKVIST